MQCGRDDVVSSLRIRVVVSTRLSNINLTRPGPGAVGTESLATSKLRATASSKRQLGSDLNTAIFDGCPVLVLIPPDLTGCMIVPLVVLGIEYTVREDRGGTSAICC